jgi:hypothetical protein
MHSKEDAIQLISKLKLHKHNVQISPTIYIHCVSHPTLYQQFAIGKFFLDGEGRQGRYDPHKIAQHSRHRIFLVSIQMGPCYLDACDGRAINSCPRPP